MIFHNICWLVLYSFHSIMLCEFILCREQRDTNDIDHAPSPDLQFTQGDNYFQKSLYLIQKSKQESLDSDRKTEGRLPLMNLPEHLL